MRAFGPPLQSQQIAGISRYSAQRRHRSKYAVAADPIDDTPPRQWKSLLPVRSANTSGRCASKSIMLYNSGFRVSGLSRAGAAVSATHGIAATQQRRTESACKDFRPLLSIHVRCCTEKSLIKRWQTQQNCKGWIPGWQHIHARHDWRSSVAHRYRRVFMRLVWLADVPLKSREQIARKFHVVSPRRGLDELATVIALMTISTEIGTTTS